MDRTPQNNPNRTRDDRPPLTSENCEGYSAEEMTALNAEFDRRWNAGEWQSFDGARAEFQDEVARR